MRVLVCGLGSVGLRHLENLRAAGVHAVAVCTSRTSLPDSVTADLPIYADLKSALRQFRPDAVIIANATSRHVGTAQICARDGCDLLIEKPLGCSLDGIAELRAERDRRRLVVMVGYMLRFHPCLLQMRQWLNAMRLGRVYWARSEWGEDVRQWHPGEDYRRSYAVSHELGGGPGLTLSHDLDLWLWLLGSPKARPHVVSNRCGEIVADTPHSVDMLWTSPEGATVNVHLDYLRWPPSRHYELYGSAGQMAFDYFAGAAILFDRRGNVVSEHRVPAGWQRNALFEEELRHFLECCRTRRPAHPSLEDGIAALELALTVT